LKLERPDAEVLCRTLNVRKTLEKHFKDVQDIEFTVQEGKLFMLQTRNGKRTAMAALKFSMDMVKEKLIDWETAFCATRPTSSTSCSRPSSILSEVKKAKVIATGLPAGPGAATGKIYFNADRAVPSGGEGRKSSARPRRNFAGRFARHDRGGRHFDRARRRQFARGARRPPDGQGLRLRRVALQVDYDKRTVTVGGQTFNEGDFLSIDGTAGTVYAGQIKTAPSEIIAGLIHGDKAAQATEKFKSYAS
jgi:pyruvate,orthophosphate dikinase